MIVSNQAKCKKCGDVIYSAHVHDFKSCKCASIAVDGGMSYIRRVGNLDTIEEMSIEVPEQVINDMKDMIKWAKDTHRNDLGLICGIFRVLRDNGYDLSTPAKFRI